ncbi:MAG: phosphoribosylglycinamide formyltransferase [Marinovum sp.]|nr:phosphoribosylglycinamide formyltransferase [Marinovum sp.]
MMTLVDAMQAGGHPATPVLVLSNRPDAGGLAKAVARGVPTAIVDHRAFAGDREAFETALSDAIAPFDLELICLAGFMRVLTAGFVSQWRDRMLNIHPSLLPKYKGLNTHARALDAGDAEAGCSVHVVTPELDDGPILGQSRVPILAGDTSATLAERVLVEEHKLYPACLTSFAQAILVARH